jgi:folate-dependent phosphoribosylglycinamide formyltransferase PurN
MRIAFLTTSVPLYLPSLFERVLNVYEDQTAGVFLVPPLGDGQMMGGPLRYYATFGLMASLHLLARTLRAKARGETIRAVCQRHGVLCESVPAVNDPLFLRRLRSLGTDLVVSVSCPQIFRKPLIELPARGTINVHGSILPAYRGVSPAFWMMANGERRAGVSAFFVNEGIDAGDLCGQRVFDLQPDDTLDRFLQRSKQEAAELVVDVLRQVENGTVDRTPLDITNGSYYSWPTRAAVRRLLAGGRRLW